MIVSFMYLNELKERLKKFDRSEIKTTFHANVRIKDRRRRINYNRIVSLLVSQKGLYR